MPGIERDYTERRRADLAKIHLAKKALGLDDDDYRAMLRRIVGVDSAAELNSRGRSKILHHLRALGFKPRPPKHLASLGQRRKIRALWMDLYAMGGVRDPTERAMHNYIRRMTGVEHSAELRTIQAITVIEALKRWRNRMTPAPLKSDPH